MATVIAEIYEIGEEIGAGGGGVVYLGRHIRLDKKIVLKADKRTLSTAPEKLRREVDLLKGLSHTYIPQVYDFVQEHEKVYTVMDYVEGESLDHLLKRRQAIPQKVIVRWACQLLEALCYLHSRKPNGILHGDIKPQNIMLRKDGDICLIDYNIALALGEDGAVRVGYSKGYASPEHYGSQGALINPLESTGEGTLRLTGESSTSGGSASPSPRRLLLDERSDLYSLGATLYHLLSGKKPAVRAADVVPLSGCCSPQIAEIIQKSMKPDKADRYQSAEEMLDAFLHLRVSDRRVKKNRRQFAAVAAISAGILLCGAGGTFTGLKQRENYESALKMASYSEASFADGDIAKAVAQAMQALDTGSGIWKAPVPAQAQKALTDALRVYDLTDGFQESGLIELASAPFALAVSPQGTRFASVYAYETAIYKTGETVPAAVRPLRKSALADCLFLDEDTVVYAGEQGVEAYDLVTGNVLWSGQAGVQLALSGDRKVLAAAAPDAGSAVLYRTADGEKIAECHFAGRRIKEQTNDLYTDQADTVFALDETGAWLAVSFADGGLSVFDTSDPENELILYEQSAYDVFTGGFCGELFAYTAQEMGMNFFGVLDLKEAALIGTKESHDRMLVRADASGICLSDGNLLARFAPDTLAETELAYTEGNTILGYDVGEQFCAVLTDDDSVSIYDQGAGLNSRITDTQRNDFVKMAGGYVLLANREEPKIRLLQLAEHADAELFSYDPQYAHNEARVSGDGKTLLLFDYQGFCTFDKDGKQIASGKLPDAEQIYDQQFIRDGSSSYLEVTWYDGTVRRYGMDGFLLEQLQREAPDREMEEEFLTDQYRIVSRLHEAPAVYDRKSGTYVAGLEADASLTYVTQLDGMILTEYVSSKLERYGILLDENLQVLAKLPDVCDVYGDTVVFDYGNGSIRSCRIYSLEELAALGSGFLEGTSAK